MKKKTQAQTDERRAVTNLTRREEVHIKDDTGADHAHTQETTGRGHRINTLNPKPMQGRAGPDHVIDGRDQGQGHPLRMKHQKLITRISGQGHGTRIRDQDQETGNRDQGHVTGAEGLAQEIEEENPGQERGI